MSSMLLTALQTPTATTGGLLPLGTAVHGYGRSIRINGDAILLRDSGYYAIDVSLSMVASVASEVSIALYANGVEIPGAFASATPSAINEGENISLTWVVKKGCCCDPTSITVVVTGTGTVNNAIVRVIKI